MSTDPIGAALARDNAAATTEAPQPASEQSSELSGIATAIERVEALLAAGPYTEGSEAIERIADIAFVLHERDVEASLCDALDAAVRELANANAAERTNVNRVRQAAEMLRELSQRVTDMITLLQMPPPPVTNDVAGDETAASERPEENELAREVASDGEIPREGLFTADLLADEEFARAVAELAASLPALVEPVEAVVVMLRAPPDFAAEEPIPALGSVEAFAVALGEPADLAAEESISAPQSDETLVALGEPADLAKEKATCGPESDDAVVVALREPAALAGGDPACAAELAEAVVVALYGPAAVVAEEPTSAPDPDEAVLETQSETNVVAMDKPGVAFELEEALAETLPEAASLTADEFAFAPEPEEPAFETQRQPAELPADQLALAEQPVLPEQPSAMTDALLIEQTRVEESPIVEIVIEQFASDDASSEPDTRAGEPKPVATSDATPASEGTLSEALSEQTLLSTADPLAQPPDLTGPPPDHLAVNGHAVLSPVDAHAPRIASDAVSSAASELAPDSEASFAPDTPPTTPPSAELELSPSSEATPPVDVDASVVSGEPPSDQTVLRHNGDGAPAPIANDSPPQGADEMLTESEAEAKEEPPRFAESSQMLLPELALVDPQDDPGDLFEPLAGGASSIAAANFAQSQSASKISAPDAEKQARFAAADPLAAMRTLSAEELLALFT